MNGFDQIVGHGNIVAALRSRVRDEKHPPLLLIGPQSSGKLTLARTYARAVLCESESKPCGTCHACDGVTNGSLRYIELNAKKFNSHEVMREQLRKLRSVGAEYVVLVVRNVECLPADVSDRLLKPLENEEWAKSHMSVLMFLSSARQDVSPAVLSRCNTYELQPSSVDEIASDLRTLCNAQSVSYELAALDVLALASKGWVGRARSLLAKCKSSGDLTVGGALSKCECGRGSYIAECWHAALRGRLDEARELSLAIGEDANARACAMQAFLETFYRRRMIGGKPATVGNSLPVYEIQDDIWDSIQLEWERLSKSRGQPVLDQVGEMIRFWSRVTGLQDWDLVFDGFCSLLQRPLSTQGGSRMPIEISIT